jgi:hypothetical membrane protein
MSWETFIRVLRWGNAVSCAGVLQFLCCLTLAVWAYPGGTPLGSKTAGYSFFENYLSDLGMTRTWAGDSNLLSSGLFNYSLLLLALATIPFFLLLPLHAADKPVLLWSASCFGVLSSLGMLGVALTPLDRHFVGHVTALFFWIVPFLAVLVLHGTAMLESREGSKLFAFPSLGLAALVVVYIVRGLIQGLPPMTHDDGHWILDSIAYQKFVFLASIAWHLVFSAKVLVTVPRRPQERVSEVDLYAEAYLQRLEGRRR